MYARSCVVNKRNVPRATGPPQGDGPGYARSALDGIPEPLELEPDQLAHTSDELDHDAHGVYFLGSRCMTS